MFKQFRHAFAVLFLMIPVFFAGMQVAQTQTPAKLHRFVIQVSREDAEGMNLALNNAMAAYGLFDWYCRCLRHWMRVFLFSAYVIIQP